MAATTGTGKVSIDPYFEGSHGAEAAAWNDRPPTPAEPTSGMDTLMHLYVPAGRTEIDYGAGVVRGIRLATDPHVHLTARDTLTTISLGSPAGEGISGKDSPGLSVFTAGAKQETVEKTVEENYKSTKTETISGDHTQKLFGKHEFGVKHDASFHFEANRSERTVGSVTSEVMADKKEQIHGAYVLTAQSKEEHILGDRKWLNHGKFVTLTYGMSNDVFIGEKTQLNVGVVASANIGGIASVNAGYQRALIAGSKLELTLQTSIAINNRVKVSKDNLKVDKSAAYFKDSGNEISRADLELLVKQNSISSSVLKIFK